MSPATRLPLAALAALVLVAIAACRAQPASVWIEPLTDVTATPADVAVVPSPAVGGGAVRAPIGSTTRAPARTAVRTPSATPSPRPGPDRLTPAASVATALPRRPLAGRDDPALMDAIERALGEDVDHASVVVKRLTDGTTASWNGDRVYYAASLYKLEVLYEAFRQRGLGVLDFDRMVPVSGRYLDEDLGTVSRLPLSADGDVAVGDAVRAMVTVSDNTSATLLLDLLGHRAIDATMKSLGLTASSVNTTELPTTAADMARVMEAIARGEGLDAGAAREMTALLLAQETRAGIPRGLPAGVPVGNKTGTWDGATHDVAVVLAPEGAYVIAVLTDGSWNWEPLTRVSRAVYEYLTRPPARASGR